MTVSINLTAVDLSGDLWIPENPAGLVIFSHGSGSSRLSPRNRFVAKKMNEAGFASLLFDLLTETEGQDLENRFNISLLTDRLIEVTKWTEDEKAVSELPMGYFGASTGAASCLCAAVHLKNKIRAVVSRGGRPDLAMEYLPGVEAAVQLIVGGEDKEVIELNEIAYEKIISEKELVIIEGATHLFEEHGKMQLVAMHAERWFHQYLA